MSGGHDAASVLEQDEGARKDTPIGVDSRSQLAFQSNSDGHYGAMGDERAFMRTWDVVWPALSKGGGRVEVPANVRVMVLSPQLACVLQWLDV